MNSPTTREATQGPQDIAALLTACEGLWSVEARVPPPNDPKGPMGDWRPLTGFKPYEAAQQRAMRAHDHLKTITHQYRVRLVRDHPRQHITFAERP